MIICAGNNETFDFAQPMGVGLIETSMNLTRACLFDKPEFLDDQILFIAKMMLIANRWFNAKIDADDIPVAALESFKNYPKWQTKIDKIEIKNGYMLKVLDFPFPLSNRFAFYKVDVSQQNGIEINLTSIPYDKLPDDVKKSFNKPDCVEMKDNVILKAVKKNGRVEIIYSAKVDPNGAPAFIFNSKIITAGYETLNNLRKLLK
jgi:hypothetical protein